MELPAEDILVETAGPGRVVGIDCEVREVIGHPPII